MTFDDGSLVNLDNVIECIRMNGQRHLDERGCAPDDEYSLRLTAAIDFIVQKINDRQTIPVNMRTLALKIVYNNMPRYTCRQFAKILSSIGQVKC